jgi:hypothetical protein
MAKAGSNGESEPDVACGDGGVELVMHRQHTHAALAPVRQASGHQVRSGFSTLPIWLPVTPANAKSVRPSP